MPASETVVLATVWNTRRLGSKFLVFDFMAAPGTIT
jgi:hypothetical protein